MTVPAAIADLDEKLARLAAVRVDAVLLAETDSGRFQEAAGTPITAFLVEMAKTERGLKLARADCLVADFNAIERNMYGAALLAVRDLALKARVAAVDLHGRSERVFEAVYQTNLDEFLAANEALIGHVDRRLTQMPGGAA